MSGHFFDNNTNLFEDYMNQSSTGSIHSLTSIEWSIYMLELGYYMHALYALLILDENLKDFNAMLTHHLMAITIMTVAYAIQIGTIGSVILMFHDGTDILMETSKCLNCFRRLSGTWGQVTGLLTVVMFLLFFISWIVFRLYLFPITILNEVTKSGPHPAIFLLFLLHWLLLSLNIYWFIFIVKILLNISDPKDVRQHIDSIVIKNKKQI
ncbi:ceramide synthase 1-like [Oppia nitens]|uniref:ceramide synthase 1-like n=1 Tax=Oppia nitens TaxID=1686743 RepID=UPI0023DAC3C4|nr:ceramide synthase 1-like [Oppia nitens]